mgnify:CR=1 FL=1
MNQNSISILKNKIKMEKNTILIIANGSSILSHEYGLFINSFENIARINNYSTSKHQKYIGEKTNIWFNGANQGLKKRKVLNQQKVIVFVPLFIHLNKQYRLNKIPKKLGISSSEYTLVSRDEMSFYEQLTNIDRPTTGLCSILWSLERYDKVIIHGFDFFQTSKGHYFDTKIKKILIKYGIINMGNKHDNVAEQIFVNKLIAQNKVNTLQKYLQE